MFDQCLNSHSDLYIKPPLTHVHVCICRDSPSFSHHSSTPAGRDTGLCQVNLGHQWGCRLWEEGWALHPAKPHNNEGRSMQWLCEQHPAMAWNSNLLSHVKATSGQLPLTQTGSNKKGKLRSVLSIFTKIHSSNCAEEQGLHKHRPARHSHPSHAFRK